MLSWGCENVSSPIFSFLRIFNKLHSFPILFRTTLILISFCPFYYFSFFISTSQNFPTSYPLSFLMVQAWDRYITTLHIKRLPNFFSYGLMGILCWQRLPDFVWNLLIFSKAISSIANLLFTSSVQLPVHVTRLP